EPVPEISADSSSNTPADSPAGSAAADNTASANPDNTVRQLGTPFPLQLQPQGLKIGPFYLTNVSDSFFYAINASPGNPTSSLAGNTATANLVFTKPVSRGTLAIQAKEQFSLSQLQPYFNQTAALDFTDQLSERWTLSASAQVAYFQNSILANPQYLLSYSNAGVVQQTVFAQQRGYNLYESNNLSMSYQMSGRTQITLTPVIGATFVDQQGGWSSARTFGGGVGVNRSFTPTLDLGVFYSLTHTITAGASSTSPGWNSQSFGMTYRQRFPRSWSVSASLFA